jgi:hypothetical protein
MKDLYKVAFDGAKAESDRFWQVFNLLSATNGAMIAFINASGQREPKVAAATAILGILICAIWFGVQARLGHWCKWWDDKMHELEPPYLEQLNSERLKQGLTTLPTDLTLFHNRKPNSFVGSTKRWPGISTRIGGKLMPALFGTVWGILLILSMSA